MRPSGFRPYVLGCQCVGEGRENKDLLGDGDGWTLVGRRGRAVAKGNGCYGGCREGFGGGHPWTKSGRMPGLKGAPREPRAMREARSGRFNRSRAGVELRNGVFRRALNEVCTGAICWDMAWDVDLCFL